MVIYKSRFLTRAEVWFDNEPAKTARPVDWILYHQRSRPIPGSKSRSFFTLLIDLSKTGEQLLGDLSDETAYKIRRARERDKITCECCNPRDPSVMNRFAQMYKTFAEMKGLAPLNRARLDNLAAAGLLDLSAAKDGQGNVLLYHANYRDSRRARQLELPSLYRALSNSGARNLSGRASRYLTWSNILRYKEQGLNFFDFGGWYPGSDPEMLNINAFKRGFGGYIVREYECEHVLTLKGRLVLYAAKLLEEPKSVLSSRSQKAINIKSEFAGIEPSVAVK
jgi:hypothetical protein